MADIDRVSGAQGPKESPVPKKETPLDAEKFKKVLKPEEISETDARAGRKRKRKEEEEEETTQEGPTAPTAKFSLDEYEAKLGSPYEVKATPPASSPPNSKTPVEYVEETQIPTTPPQEDRLWEESFEQRVSQAPPPTTPPTAKPSTPITEEKATAKKRREIPQKEMIPPSLKKEKAAQREGPSPTMTEKEKLEKEKLQAAAAKQAAPSKEKEIEKAPMAPPKGKEVQPAPSVAAKEKEEAALQKAKVEKAVPLQPEKREKGKEVTPSPIIGPSPLEAQLPPLPAQEAISLPKQAEIHEFYYQMVGTIIASIPSKSGDLHIVVNLNSPNFEKSRFFGTQIIIERFSTAPGVYHIQLAAKTEANLALFRGEQDSLQNVLKQGLPFDVRLRPPVLAQESATGYRTVRRKEAGGETGEQKREK